MPFPLKAFGITAARVAATLILVALAIVTGTLLWNYYVLTPWTRDGRVRADVVTLATEVPGRVVELHVSDNQRIAKGDVLLVVDPASYRIALQQAEANAAASEATMKERELQARRRAQLSSIAISQEATQNAELEAQAAAAGYQQALAQRDAARLALDRTILRAPVNGFVTNLTLRVGDYAQIGQALIALLDTDSYRVEAYIEETKLPRVREGAAAEIRLMSGGPTLTGHVQGIARGIYDIQNPTSTNLLLSVNPVFEWVRLAQRIPVRIALDTVPEGVFLASGMTCTVLLRTEPDGARPLRSN